MTAKFSFSLLASQKCDTAFLRPCSCCALLEATEGTRGSLESGIKATSGSYWQHLKRPHGKSLCYANLQWLRGDFGYLTPTAPKSAVVGSWPEGTASGVF